MEINEKLKNLIGENDVCLFMKGTPDSPQCGFSMTVSNVLKHLKVNFKSVNVLDDVNIRKFTRVLNNFSNETQFIVVTHNKLTMESANFLYGVTMEKKGVSQLVSVKLD